MTVVVVASATTAAAATRTTFEGTFRRLFVGVRAVHKLNSQRDAINLASVHQPHRFFCVLPPAEPNDSVRTTHKLCDSLNTPKRPKYLLQMRFCDVSCHLANPDSLEPLLSFSLVLALLLPLLLL